MSLPATLPLWASLPVPALVIDGEDQVIAANGPAETFLNTSARVLEGQGIGSRLVTTPALDEALRRLRQTGAPVLIAEADLCPAGRAPLQSPGAVLVLVTPREAAERLGRGTGAARAARAAIGMAEMLAHEIKNPLAGIAGAAQLLAMNLRGEDLELTDLIVAETQRVVKLLEQVERFGDLRPPQRRVVNLHDALDRARRSALVGFGARMRIVEDYDPSLPPTMADPDQLMQVFLNLLKNAAEAAGPGGGTIRLHTFYDQSLRRLRPDGTGAGLPLQVEITDDGPGVPPALTESLFEPFVSGRENGTGLGLALVSKIVSEHEGWISVESRPGRTTFRLSLPLAPRGAAVDEKE
jgi:two-component system nitrogen regulation sensor histidine kinase GlnL